MIEARAPDEVLTHTGNKWHSTTSIKKEDNYNYTLEEYGTDSTNEKGKVALQRHTISIIHDDNSILIIILLRAYLGKFDEKEEVEM